MPNKGIYTFKICFLDYANSNTHYGSTVRSKINILCIQHTNYSENSIKYSSLEKSSLRDYKIKLICSVLINDKYIYMIEEHFVAN